MNDTAQTENAKPETEAREFTLGEMVTALETTNATIEKNSETIVELRASNKDLHAKAKNLQEKIATEMKRLGIKTRRTAKAKESADA